MQHSKSLDQNCGISKSVCSWSKSLCTLQHVKITHPTCWTYNQDFNQIFIFGISRTEPNCSWTLNEPNLSWKKKFVLNSNQSSDRANSFPEITNWFSKITKQIVYLKKYSKYKNLLKNQLIFLFQVWIGQNYVDLCTTHSNEKETLQILK